MRRLIGHYRWGSSVPIPERVPECELSICITVKNRSLVEADGHVLELFPRCIESIPSGVEVVVADFGSDDRPLKEWLPPEVKITSLQGRFSRGRGLNAAALASSGRVLFFLDADMLVGEGVLEKAVEVCRGGKGYFPIVWGYDDPDHSIGSWIGPGYGNCALGYELYRKVEGWPELDRWGGEDDLIFEKVKESGAQVVREREAGLKHQWHPQGREWKERYV